MKSGVGRDGRSRRRGRKRSGKLAPARSEGPWRSKGWAMEVVAMNPWSHGSRDGGRPWGAKWVERAEQRKGPGGGPEAMGVEGMGNGERSGREGRAGGAGGHALGAFKVICSGP